jgi:hypothetical protein
MPTYKQNAAPAVPEGEYDFTVKNAKEETSKKGNEMIVLTLQIKDGPIVVDNLVFDDEGKAIWKIDEFRIATGEVINSTEEVEFTSDQCLGRTGRCSLYVDDYEGRKRNKVEHYLPPGTTRAGTTAAAGASSAGTKKVGYNELGEPDDIPY